MTSPVDHAEMFVPQRYVAAGWYRDLLGLEIVASLEHWADDPHGPLMISGDGGVTNVALFRGDPEGRDAEGGCYQLAFRKTGEAFMALLDSLADMGLQNRTGQPVTARSATDHGDAFSLYFLDPWGHRLEVTTYDHDYVRTALQER